MKIFGKEKEEKATAVDAVQEAAKALVNEYSDLKGKEYEMKKRRDEIVLALKELADANQKWKGKTARFNQYAVERKEVKSLLVPAQMSIEDFSNLDELGYVKRELDKTKILKSLSEDPVFEHLNFEVEIKESFVIKGF